MISLRAFSFLFCFVFLCACMQQVQYKTFRMPTQDDPPIEELCGKPHDLGARNREDDGERFHRCPIQRHLLPGSDEARQKADPQRSSADTQNEWLILARKKAKSVDSTQLYQLRNHEEYYLGFLELTKEGALSAPKQKTLLEEHFRKQGRANGGQNVVIAYVHGWRHDAQVRDGDVLKLRRVLAQTRAALNTRCIEQDRYCDATVTGVFIGWNGRIINEGPSDITPDLPAQGGITSLPAIDTFGQSFDASNEIAAYIWEQLDWLNTTLRRDYGNSKADKLLIVGHSMGGNVLAQEMVAKVTQQIGNHDKGKTLEPILGDMVLLLNPASDAKNWTEIQKAERAKVNLSLSGPLTCRNVGEDGALQASDCSKEEQKKIIDWQNLYPDTQRPTYISLTAVDDWGRVKNKRRKIDYDKATGNYFPIGRWFFGGQDAKFETAIGHADPEYQNESKLKASSSAVGTTHEISVLSGPRTTVRATRYSRPTSVEAGWCAPGDGWLLHARHSRPYYYGPWKAIYNERWEYGWVHSEYRSEIPPNIGGLQNKARVKWVQGINLEGSEDRLSVAPRNTPFWNVRAHDTAIKNHAGWSSANTWCAINQLVLDDVTAELLYMPKGSVENWKEHYKFIDEREKSKRRGE